MGLKKKSKCPVCRSKISSNEFESLTCLPVVTKLLDTADNGVTNVAHEVEPLVEQFESLMHKGSKNYQKAPKKAEKKSTKAGDSAKGLPPHAFTKNEIALESQPDYNPLHYQKLNKEEKKVFKGEMSPDDDSSASDSEVSSSDGSTISESDSDESTLSGSSSDSSSGDSSSDSSDDSSDSSDESSSRDMEEHSTMTSEEEDTEAEVKSMERKYKIGQKVAVFPDKDSYRVNHVIGTIRQVVKVKGEATKYFGIHLIDTTSRGLGVKLTDAQLDNKAKRWYAKGRESRVWIKANKICDHKLVVDL